MTQMDATVLILFRKYINNKAPKYRSAITSTSLVTEWIILNFTSMFFNILSLSSIHDEIYYYTSVLTWVKLQTKLNFLYHL